MIRRWVKRWLGLYDIDDLLDRGVCGLCGKMVQRIVPRAWFWTICKDGTGCQPGMGE